MARQATSLASQCLSLEHQSTAVSRQRVALMPQWIRLGGWWYPSESPESRKSRSSVSAMGGGSILQAPDGGSEECWSTGGGRVPRLALAWHQPRVVSNWDLSGPWERPLQGDPAVGACLLEKAAGPAGTVFRPRIAFTRATDGWLALPYLVSIRLQKLVPQRPSLGSSVEHKVGPDGIHVAAGAPHRG
jgi:hypothetical protein